MAISSKDLESLWQRYKVESVDGVSDMERKQYLDQIHELVQTVQTLLDANIALSNKQKEQKAEYDRKIAGLQTCRLMLISLQENCKTVGVNACQEQ